MTSPEEMALLESDASLIQRIVRQDALALSQLYDRYSRVLYGLAYRSLNSVEESEEAVLDVFSQVWRTAATYDGRKARVDGWLFMIMRSRVLDRLRKYQRSQKVCEASVDQYRQLPQTSVDPLEDAVVRDRRAMVLTALGQLPPEQRFVIELAYYQGFSHSEIAQRTGLALGTIKTRLRLGLNKLRQALDPDL